MKRFSTILCGLIALCLNSYGQVYDHNTGWHYSDTVTAGTNITRYFLWLPQSANTGGGLRGLIMSSQTVAEEAFSKDPALRLAAEEAQLGILYFNSGVLTGFGTNAANINRDTTMLLRALNKLADVSGFEALRHCPWFTFGHSSGSAFARNIPWWKPERCFGAIVFKGGAISQPSWTSNSIAQVPILGVNGQYEEYGPNGGCANPRDNEANFYAVRDSILKLRSGAVRQLGAAVMLPHEGHFAYARPEGAAFMALFVKKAANARIPAGIYADAGPITLNSIDETTGWAVDTAVFSTPILDSVPNISSPETRFWFFDRELAQAYINLFIKTGNNIYSLTRSSFAGQGNTPQIAGATALNYNDCNGKSWVGNTTVGEALTISGPTIGNRALVTANISGPVSTDGNNTFTVNPTLFPDYTNAWLQLWTDADASSSGADRMVRLRVSRRTSGQNNVANVSPITTKQPGDQFSPTITLSSGLTPYITVVSGPATVSNGQITVTTIPALKDSVPVQIRVACAGNGVYATSNVAEATFWVRQPIVSLKKNLDQNSLVLSPNPGRGYVEVTGPSSLQLESILVLDMAGKAHPVKMTGQIIDVSNLAQGVYLARFKTQDGLVTKRLVIQ